MGATISNLFDNTVYVIDKDGNIRKLIQQPAYAGNILIDRPDCLLVRAKDVRRMVMPPRSIQPMEKLRPGELYFLICDEWRASPPSPDKIKDLIAKVERSKNVGCF